MKHEITTLKRGLKVITAPMPEMESAAIGIWVRCGSRHEAKRLSGISHFIEHLVFKGTRKRDGHDISMAIEGIGGHMNASTGEEFTFYYCQVVKDKLAFALDTLIDMVLHPTFRTEHLRNQKAIIVEEIKMYLDRPATLVQDLLSGLVWPDQPLGRPILGSQKTIMGIERKDIVAYKNRMYTAPNIVIAVAGDVNHADVVTGVKKYSRSFKQGRANRHTAARNPQRKPAFLIHTKETEQTHLSLGVRTFRRHHPDRFGLKLISTILGENMSSRLFREVRENLGLAYSISSGIDRYLDTGALVISGGVVTVKTKDALKVILREMRKLKRVSVSKDELERAKQYVIGTVRMGIEKTMSRMIWTGEDMLLSGKFFSPDELIEKINRVTTDDIRRIANSLFRSSRLNIAIVGPLSAKEKIGDIVEL